MEAATYSLLYYNRILLHSNQRRERAQSSSELPFAKLSILLFQRQGILYTTYEWEECCLVSQFSIKVMLNTQMKIVKNSGEQRSQFSKIFCTIPYTTSKANNRLGFAIFNPSKKIQGTLWNFDEWYSKSLRIKQHFKEIQEIKHPVSRKDDYF